MVPLSKNILLIHGPNKARYKGGFRSTAQQHGGERTFL